MFVPEINVKTLQIALFCNYVGYPCKLAWIWKTALKTRRDMLKYRGHGSWIIQGLHIPQDRHYTHTMAATHFSILNIVLGHVMKR